LINKEFLCVFCGFTYLATNLATKYILGYEESGLTVPPLYAGLGIKKDAQCAFDFVQCRLPLHQI
jgi:hypothetical protein